MNICYLDAISGSSGGVVVVGAVAGAGADSSGLGQSLPSS